ncbi:sulfurtransferase complex subunit TusB [uncultured Psychromonas sp.]|uniref:sulfurtransferase complex subunit TusB n=1 Tax=uncultured Psychromonas sp. TaxID=173974 RepID=UPI00263722A4|nr:sulfurtransferase complex subunit TusB [uncultured Psychromonas sp.]
MILHTVSGSPFNSFALKGCVRQLGENDLLLLLNDAVSAVTTTTDQHLQLLQLDQSKRLFVLDVDLQARGLKANIGQVVSYAEFVVLSIRCQSQLAW